MKCIALGKIVKPQGIKGEVKAICYNDATSLVDLIKKVSIGEREYAVKHISFRQGFLFLLLDGVNDRNAAELLRNKEIMVDREILEQTVSGDEFLVDDLIGLNLYDLDGQFVGQILDVESYGGGDIFTLNIDGRTRQAPFVKDVFIKNGQALVVDRKKLSEVLI